MTLLKYFQETGIKNQLKNYSQSSHHLTINATLKQQTSLKEMKQMYRRKRSVIRVFFSSFPVFDLTLNKKEEIVTPSSKKAHKWKSSFRNKTEKCL
jgi:hypothetical protein